MNQKSEFDKACHNACASGNVPEVIELRAQGFDIHRPMVTSGHTPLCTAAWEIKLNLLRYFLDEGADVHAVAFERDLPALSVLAHQSVADGVSMLLERGADPNLPAGETGVTALHAVTANAYKPEAAECVRVLLEVGADPNVKTIAGSRVGFLHGGVATHLAETPLHLAAAYGSQETIELLVEAGADRTSRDINGATPQAWFEWHRRSEHRVEIPASEEAWELLS